LQLNFQEQYLQQKYFAFENKILYHYVSLITFIYIINYSGLSDMFASSSKTAKLRLTQLFYRTKF
jgi:hypothetical protein